MTELLLPTLTAALYAMLALMTNFRTSPASSSTGGQSAIHIQILTAGTLALHAFLSLTNISGPAGVDLSLANTLSLTALVTVSIFWLSSWQTHLDGFGIIVMPMAAICVLLPALPFGSAHPMPLSGPLLGHILLSVIAYSLLAVASLQALFMAYIDYHIRHKHPGRLLAGMPSLQQLETLLFRFILVGLVVLTASLASGWLYMDNLFAQQVVHKTVLSLLAWLVYATLLLGHYRLGWRGQTAVRLCLVAFGLLVLGYIGSKFVLEIILGR